jgi:hypothetical protein
MDKKQAKSYRSLRKTYQETGDIEALNKAYFCMGATVFYPIASLLI